MEKQQMDLYSQEEILGQMKEKALSYVPEWKFDETFPDGGTALAFVYGKMLYQTQKKFNQIFTKNRIAFLNQLDAGLLPAVPAKGYVTFSLVNEDVPGCMVPAGTTLSAQCDKTESGSVNYRTTDEVYVSPASLTAIFQSFDGTDTVEQFPMASKETELPLFSQSGCNLQRHELYIGHNEALGIRGEGWIQLKFFLRGDIQIPEEILKLLADRDRVAFEYPAEGSYHEFSSVTVKNGSIILSKAKNQPPMERTTVDGTETYFIRCTPKVLDGLKEFHFERMILRSEGASLPPDSVITAGTECFVHRYIPFGERLTEFEEVYFTSQVLEKKGAFIELGFYLEFNRIPLEYGGNEQEVPWDWIMKQPNLKTDPEYDITIDAVAWEYYNGRGWARLYPDDSNSHIFFPEHGLLGGYKKINFICPSDMTPLAVGSRDSCCIRARITRVNNKYKMKGAYVVPVLENTVFRYRYQDKGLMPQHLITYNNLEYYHGPGGCSSSSLYPFVQMGDENKAVYLGFQTAPTQGPIKLLFLLKQNPAAWDAGLLWQYWNGNKWNEINLADETKGLTQTGIATLMGNDEMKKGRLMGRDLFWIRITDVEGYYKNPSVTLPVTQGIYMNAAKIVNVDKEEIQYFKMELFQENMRFFLMDQKIVKADVYVDETGQLTNGEMEELKRQGLLDLVFDGKGSIKETWVKWTCTEDSTQMQPGDRVCLLNRNEGYLAFGNGRAGRIPPVSRKDNIRIRYLTGGGTHTNAPAGAVKKLGHEIGYINRVSNPVALTGGCDPESLEDALRRNCARIRHQNRGITARDFEELVLESCRTVRRAVCFPGYDKNGHKRPGTLTLVVMTDGEEGGDNRFDTVRELIIHHLTGKVSGYLMAKGIAIREPDWIELGVRAEIVVKSSQSVYQVRKQVAEKLEKFLNPFTGNFHGKGWEVGSLPGPMQIKNTLSDSGISAIDYIRSVNITAHIRQGSELREIDIPRLKGNPYILPVNGRHQLSVTHQKQDHR